MNINEANKAVFNFQRGIYVEQELQGNSCIIILHHKRETTRLLSSHFIDSLLLSDRKKTVRSKLGRHLKRYCVEKAKKNNKNLDIYVSHVNRFCV